MGDTARRYTQVTKAVYERPWAITEPMLRSFEEIIRLRVSGSPLSEEQIETRIAAAERGPRSGPGRAQGVAVIPIYGVISQRMSLMSAMSGGTSVEGITQAFRAAQADPDIGAIVFDIDSPGGAVEGIDELAAEIRAARGVKPMAAVADAEMNSAAYYIGSAADQVIVTPSGRLGSVGIIAMRPDVSKADEKDGVTYHVITAGGGKGTWNEHVPLSEEGRDEITDMAEDYYAMFVSAVAAGRGVPAATVTDEWKAKVFTAKKAVAAGLANRIDTLDATVRRYVGKVNRTAMSATMPNFIGEGGTAFDASAIGRHKTATSDGSWDGPANEKRLPNERGSLRAAHAWQDDDGDPDAKASFRFIHHEVSGEGTVGAANLTACSTGIGVLNGGRGGTTIPDSDRAGVHAHLAGHLRDAGREAPPLRSESTPTDIAALLATMPIHEQAALWTSERDRILAHYEERERLRAKVGRSLSAQIEEQRAALASLDLPSELVDPDLVTDDSEEAAPPQVAGDWRGRARLDVLEAAARGGYPLPQREVSTDEQVRRAS